MINSSYEPSYDSAFGDVYRSVLADIPQSSFSSSTGGSRIIDGGKAIASGGYGCVFRPAIKCEGEKSPRRDSISKLMKRTKAEDEMDEVKNAEKVLSVIPNYEKYFAVTGYHMCKPAALTKEDEDSFDMECRSPLGAQFSHVNAHLGTYRLVVSPDLGTDLSKAIKDMFRTAATTPGTDGYNDLLRNLVNLNSSAADILENGIAKMAALKFYHSDVKPQNVMTDYNRDLTKPSFTQMKLIDFGLALPNGASSADVNTFIMFNAPVSSFLFDRGSRLDVDTMLQRAGHIASPEKAAAFATKQMEKIVKKYVFKNASRTHIPYIESVGSVAYGSNAKAFRKFLLAFFTQYATRVVLSFIRGGYNGAPSFNEEKYWNEVYRFNLDVWGFLTTFLLIASYSRNSHPEISSRYLAVVDKYLYNVELSTVRIPVDDVVTTLNEITNGFRKQYAPPQPDPIRSVVVQPKKVTKTKKRRLVIVKEFGARRDDVQRSVVTLSSTRKRCPKGYKRHKHDKAKCVKVDSNQKSAKPQKVGVTLKGNRCPKGYKRHKTLKDRCVEALRKN